MKLNSLYKFYQGYFHYESKTSDKQRFMYAFAIRDTNSILREVYYKQDNDPIYEYLNRVKKSPLTINFLNNIQLLAGKRYIDPVDNFVFLDSYINVQKAYISTNRKEIVIPCPYICDKNNNKEIIILTFGPSTNILDEVAVLKGLIKEFNIDKPFPKSIIKITYWDLSTGKETTVDYVKIKPASIKTLIETLNKF